MKFIALKTKDGKLKGNIAFYCRSLHVSRQGFYQYLANKDRPWKYQSLADAMKEILEEDECNDTYGRIRMYQALTLLCFHLFVTDTDTWSTFSIGTSVTFIFFQLFLLYFIGKHS